jgi:hypothetical protein
VQEELFQKIKTLHETIWERNASRPKIEEWLSNFEGNAEEKLAALYLLSNFMYFGSKEIRELLKALYRDIFKYPIIEAIRKANNDTLDADYIQQEFQKELHKTRFLGVGNPSESGCHLLYYFRQENLLPKSLFIHTHEIFSRRGSPPSLAIKDTQINRYVFLDDFCGSGSQAKDYSKDVLEVLKSLNGNAKSAYYMLFATETGLREIRDHTHFDFVDAVFKLDDSYKCFDAQSRYFIQGHRTPDKEFSKNMCLYYGGRLCPSDPLGYKNGQLLIGFHHNIPDNTLPIIWYDDPGGLPWKPIFRRYPKIYGWGGS